MLVIIVLIRKCPVYQLQGPFHYCCYFLGDRKTTFSFLGPDLFVRMPYYTLVSCGAVTFQDLCSSGLVGGFQEHLIHRSMSPFTVAAILHPECVACLFPVHTVRGSLWPTWPTFVQINYVKDTVSQLNPNFFVTPFLGL